MQKIHYVKKPYVPLIRICNVTCVRLLRTCSLILLMYDVSDKVCIFNFYTNSLYFCLKQVIARCFNAVLENVSSVLYVKSFIVPVTNLFHGTAK